MRGGHFHHTKAEKFLVVHGTAKFSFFNVDTNETLNITVSGSNYEIVETIPGWQHAIENKGDSILFAIVWANEVFDAAAPDTFNF